MKKILILLYIGLFLIGCAINRPKIKYTIERQREFDRIVTELGAVYVGMPKEDLARLGYTKRLQKDYHKEGTEEWITFLNWPTKKPDDLVTFYILRGKVRGWKERQ